jgi:hypothetical protein
VRKGKGEEGRSTAPFSQTGEGRDGVGVRLARPSGGENVGVVVRALEEGGSSDRQRHATDGGDDRSGDTT